MKPGEFYDESTPIGRARLASGETRLMPPICRVSWEFEATPAGVSYVRATGELIAAFQEHRLVGGSQVVVLGWIATESSLLDLLAKLPPLLAAGDPLEVSWLAFRCESQPPALVPANPVHRTKRANLKAATR